MELYIYNKKIWKNALHTQPLNQFETRLSYGDDFNATLHFPAGTLSAGDEILLAIDSDMFFGQNGTSPMAMQIKTITADDATSQTATFTLSTNTERFYTVVNGKQTPVLAYLGIYQHKATSTEDFPQIELALGAIGAMPVVGLFSDTIVPVEPADLYYTKQQADGVFVAQSEKGIANGIATLDENGKVPESELPTIDYIPTGEKGVANGVATLDSTGKVPSTELPAMDYVPTSAVGVASGVATLDANSLVPREQLPTANGTNFGTIRGYDASGYSVANGLISFTNASANNISGRSGGRLVKFSQINAAVIATLTDANHITLTATQQATAQGVFFATGITQPISTIPAATASYTLADGVYQHTPDTAPTYTLPDVSDTSRTHTIVIVMDFATAGSIAFQDSQGTTIAPLPSASPIAQGKTFAFLCTFQALLSKWVIMPIYLEVE